MHKSTYHWLWSVLNCVTVGNVLNYHRLAFIIVEKQYKYNHKSVLEIQRFFPGLLEEVA